MPEQRREAIRLFPEDDQEQVADPLIGWPDIGIEGAVRDQYLHDVFMAPLHGVVHHLAIINRGVGTMRYQELDQLRVSVVAGMKERHPAVLISCIR